MQSLRFKSNIRMFMKTIKNVLHRFQLSLNKVIPFKMQGGYRICEKKRFLTENIVKCQKKKLTIQDINVKIQIFLFFYDCYLQCTPTLV